MTNVPLGERSVTLACGRMVAGRECEAPAAWHVSWYEDGVRAGAWDNSLCCQEHMDDAQQRWTGAVGWRHRVSHACGMPGALLHIAEEGVDCDGNPVTYCRHPWDECAEAEAAEELLSASAL